MGYVNLRAKEIDVTFSFDAIGDEPEDTEQTEGSTGETDRNERDAKVFKSGFDSAIKETMLWYGQGKLPELYESLGKEVPAPGYMEPLFDLDDEPVKVSTNTGENDMDPSPSVGGRWTMSGDELNSRLDESYNRGIRDGSASPRHTTARTLRTIARELYKQLEDEPFEGGVDDERAAMFEIRHNATHNSSSMSQRGFDLAVAKVADSFTLALAARLGFKVTA